MPRPSKNVQEQKRQAAQAWKKGDRAEAQELWTSADKARKELQAKKRKNNQGQPKADEAGEGQGTSEG